MDWKKIVKERDAWIEHNFPNRIVPDPGESVIGVIEEVGELAHAWLKREQAIRGEQAELTTLIKDAVGDITIYLLGVMSYSDKYPERFPTHRSPSMEWMIRRLATDVGSLAQNHAQYYVEGIIADLIRICEIEGWDYERVVQETWDHVKQRDWIAYPETGMPSES